MYRYSSNLFVVISTCLVGSWLLALTSANGPAALDDFQRYLLIVTVITGDEHDVDDNAHEQSKALLFFLRSFPVSNQRSPLLRRNYIEGSIMTTTPQLRCPAATQATSASFAAGSAHY